MSILVMEDWKTFKNFATPFVYRGARVVYQERKVDNTVEIKICAGSIGFEGEYKEDSEELKEIRDWLQLVGGGKVKKVIPVDLFFTT